MSGSRTGSQTAMKNWKRLPSHHRYNDVRNVCATECKLVLSLHISVMKLLPDRCVPRGQVCYIVVNTLDFLTPAAAAAASWGVVTLQPLPVKKTVFPVFLFLYYVIYAFQIMN